MVMAGENDADVQQPSTPNMKTQLHRAAFCARARRHHTLGRESWFYSRHLFKKIK